MCHLSLPLQEVIQQYHVSRQGTGRGGPRISLFEKWVHLRQSQTFPDVDLKWILLEFSRAASHAAGYWRGYDARVRQFIIQNADPGTLERVNRIRDESESSADENATHSHSQVHQQQQLQLRGPLALEPPPPPSPHQVAEKSSSSDDEDHVPSRQKEHDWKTGARLGEARNPGPPRRGVASQRRVVLRGCGSVRRPFRACRHVSVVSRGMAGQILNGLHGTTESPQQSSPRQRDTPGFHQTA